MYIYIKISHSLVRRTFPQWTEFLFDFGGVLKGAVFWIPNIFPYLLAIKNIKQSFSVTPVLTVFNFY